MTNVNSLSNQSRSSRQVLRPESCGRMAERRMHRLLRGWCAQLTLFSAESQRLITFSSCALLTELKKAGVWEFLTPGDIVWNAAVYNADSNAGE